MSALADWLDARKAIVHEWHGQGVPVDQIVMRLTPDAEAVREWLRAPSSPFPGSSRAQVVELLRRLARAESALHAVRTTPPDRRPPTDSEFRSLALHPDPELCGCQHWSDTLREGEHNPHCEHATKQR